MTSEAGDDWGRNGLGYYLAQRMLWNVENSKKLDAHTEEFLRNCFGPAAATMKEFYKLLDGSNHNRLSSDLIGRMYRLLDKARKEAAGNKEILGRLNDLAVYTRYSEIFMEYQNAPKKAKGAAVIKLIKFAARSKNTRMVHSRAIFRETERMKRLAGIKDKKINIDWETSKEFTPEEIKKFIADGIAANKLLDFTPVAFSGDLVPATTLMKPPFANGEIKMVRRGLVSYYIWADKKPRPITLTVTGGLIPWYRNRGNVRIKLYKIGGASEAGTRETLIQTDRSVPPDGKPRTVTLSPKQSGLHKISINDGSDRTRVIFSKGTLMTFSAERTRDPYAGTFLFYVPKGTKKLGFFSQMHRGLIISPDGERRFRFKQKKKGVLLDTNTGRHGC